MRYAVTFEAKGTVTLLVDADSPAHAEEVAEERFNEGGFDADEDTLELGFCVGAVPR